VPSLFTPPFGVPTTDGVPASLGGVPGLEPASVLCDPVAVTVALGRVGACTRCDADIGVRAKRKKDARAPCVIPSVRNPFTDKMEH
jgi:hypothetical protein